jgi:choline dehydrogenase
MSQSTFDYVVIGAGTAGCVLANRLSADPSVSVLLIEAGGADRHPMIHVPAGFIRLIDHHDITWRYRTARDPHTGSREIVFPRGRVLGGSSSINGLLYVRPYREDLDEWATLSDDSWRYDNVLPYYRKSETWTGNASPMRGTDGPVRVTRTPEPPQICHAAIKAGQEAGLRYVDDPNQPHTYGSIWYYQQTRDGRRRSSAARGYLRPALGRQNLTVMTRCQVSRLLISNKVCQGVAIRREGGQLEEVYAQREVLLSAGAIGSPQILQVSGIGPAGVLEENGVRPVHHLEGVGSNLQDHYIVRLGYSVKNTLTANERGHGLRLIGEVMNYVLRGKGLLTFSASSVGAFYQSKYSQRPDVQYVMAGGSFKHGRIGELEDEPGVTIGCWQMRPKSRGHVHIKSADVTVAPEINPSYLSDSEDAAIIAEGLKFGRELFTRKSLSPYVITESIPGYACSSDEALIGYARSNGSTVFHPVGTCAMGLGSASVVDPQLRVRGIERLRVVDASIMPNITSTNTNATVLMIAEKAAAIIIAAQ